MRRPAGPIQRRGHMGRPSILATGIILALLMSPTGAVGAASPEVNQSDYVATGLPGHPELDFGGVIDITLGRESGALEIHTLSGAAASTDYEVVGEVFLASACSADDPLGSMLVPEGVLTTDDQGDGLFEVRFPGEAFGEAPDTFWVRWLLKADGLDAYRSDCVGIEL